MINSNDISILFYLYRFTFLHTKQLAKLAGRSSPVVRRAVRTRLIPRGLVSEIKRPNARSQAIYRLSKKGLEYIADMTGESVRDLPVSSRCPSTSSPHWIHWVEVNKYRVNFFLALRDDDFIHQYRDVSEFEVSRPNSKSSTERFEIWEDLQVDHRCVRFQPDNLQLLSTTIDGDEHLSAFFLELDRGSESIMRTIRLKYLMYKEYFDHNLYHERFGAHSMRVLFVLGSGPKTRQRLNNLQSELRNLCTALGDEHPRRPSATEGEISPGSFAWSVRFAFLDDLLAGDSIYTPMWFDFRDNPLPLYRRPLSFAPQNALGEGDSTTLPRGVTTEIDGSRGESVVISGT